MKSPCCDDLRCREAGLVEIYRAYFSVALKRDRQLNIFCLKTRDITVSIYAGAGEENDPVERAC